ncbi:DGQHR domain-containing protein [Acetobacter lovaniensis]|uniref:DGQHR domain-containing protein n=1 Tax=Acetobacter lovaniensis TaxID=104100 RepID=A0A841QKJ1_9PROT|nr:DGQHR domain-containing protein [Acetobacter lovaniensis]MBB6458502.1 DGQHR domain-containing protein [Acetobacter lovaniensis]NHN82712.1 DGQHR domain-containing protein [Acetobacter lovaniensis]GBQ74151.1 hypothetical protein AA0474_3138 [Acetobacter lovaniensis NRIC 0474]
MTCVELPFLEINQHGTSFFLVNMPASIITKVSYAAVRGRDEEQGAVQRVLNTRRIASIRDFALSGGFFPNSIVMNWVRSESIEIDQSRKILSITPHEYSAQLIDGQHRVAGLAEAINSTDGLKDINLPVAIYVGLTTKECADIFLSINTEQKPVHRSLVFDLYAIADDQIIDPAAARARDIAIELSEDGAPYHGMIKFPGEPPRKGGVALSTIVTTIKPLIEKNGPFDQVSLSTLENQSLAIINFFRCLEEIYGEAWFERQNAFMFAAGFSGAVDFLTARMIPYCVGMKSFKSETMRHAINMTRENLIYQKELTGKSGSEAQKYVFVRLDELFDKGESADEYAF